MFRSNECVSVCVCLFVTVLKDVRSRTAAVTAVTQPLSNPVRCSRYCYRDRSHDGRVFFTLLHESDETGRKRLLRPVVVTERAVVPADATAEVFHTLKRIRCSPMPRRSTLDVQPTQLEWTRPLAVHPQRTVGTTTVTGCTITSSNSRVTTVSGNT